MSEFTQRIGRKLPYVMLVGLLGAAGCGESVRDDIFPDLNCGKNPDNTKTRTYEGMLPGEKVLLGHAFADNDGDLNTDASVSLDSGGKIAVQDLDRKSLEIQPNDHGGIIIKAENEQFDVSPWAGSSIHIIGTCVKPA